MSMVKQVAKEILICLLLLLWLIFSSISQGCKAMSEGLEELAYRIHQGTMEKRDSDV
jgi:hypothetical protein